MPELTITFRCEVDGDCPNPRTKCWEWFVENMPGGGEIDGCVVWIEGFKLQPPTTAQRQAPNGHGAIHKSAQQEKGS